MADLAELGEFGGDDLELSAQEMQKQIEQLESAIATAEQETAESEALQQQEPDMETMNQELARIDEEIEKIANEAAADENIDALSVYVGNVDYGSSSYELQKHFASCGIVERVTILTNKWTGQPMGYAYVQFQTEEAVVKALALSESLFRGRQLKVSRKRVNVPFMGKGRAPARRPRGAGKGYGSWRPRPRRFSKGYHPYWY